MLDIMGAQAARTTYHTQLRTAEARMAFLPSRERLTQRLGRNLEVWRWSMVDGMGQVVGRIRRVESRPAI